MIDDDFYYHGKSDNEYPPQGLNGTNSLYSPDGFSSSTTNRNASYYNSPSDNRPVSTYKPTSHYHSMDSIQANGIARVGQIFVKINSVLLGVVILFSILGFLTDGSALGFDKVDGIISDNQRISGYTYSRSYKPRYRTTIKYTYKDKEYTMMGQSVYPKTVNQNVNIYISRFDSSQIYYFENTSSLIAYISPLYVILFVLWTFSFIISNQDSHTSRYLMIQFDKLYILKKFSKQDVNFAFKNCDLNIYNVAGDKADKHYLSLFVSNSVVCFITAMFIDKYGRRRLS